MTEIGFKNRSIFRQEIQFVVSKCAKLAHGLCAIRNDTLARNHFVKKEGDKKKLAYNKTQKLHS